MASSASRPESIGEHAKICLELFSQNIQLLDKSEDYHSRDGLLDELGRFKLWTSNIGVFAELHSSLDFRLREFNDIKHPFVRQLITIETRLRQFNEDVQQTPPKCSTDDEEDKADSPPSNSRTNSQFQVWDNTQLLQSIHESIDWLHKLSNLVRKASFANQNKRADKFKLEDEDNNDLTEILRNYYEKIIKREFDGLSETLIDRLATSMLTRRRRIMYRRSQQQRWKLHQVEYTAKTLEPTIKRAPETPSTLEPKTASPTEGALQLGETRKAVPTRITVTTLDAEKYRHVSAPSRISKGTTAPLDKKSKLLVPPPPIAAKLSETFVCDYCCLILPSQIASNDKSWADHIQKDLCPYVCVADNCDGLVDIYPSKKEWLHHIRTHHLMRWYCAAKSHAEPLVLEYEEEFIEHMKTAHPGKFQDDQLSFIAESSCHPKDPIFDNCPFCTETCADLVEHIAAHLRNIALRSLPWPEDAGQASQQGTYLNSDNSSSGADTRDTTKDFELTDYSSHNDQYHLFNMEGEIGPIAGERLRSYGYFQEIAHQHLAVRVEEQLSDKIMANFVRNQYPDEKRTALHSIDQEAVLDLLPVAVGAHFDSTTEEQNPTCLPNTRVEVLDQILEWAHNRYSRSIFWLSGIEGTGKSTISRTVATLFAARGILGATFFFKRGEGDRGSLAKFFTTIAAQLTRIRPAIFPFLKKAVDAGFAIGDMALEGQFDKLISQPLKAALSSFENRDQVVIVVDALDECEEEAAARLIPQLFEGAGSLGLKLFVTGRPELQLRFGFLRVDHTGVMLDEIPKPIIDQDISTFLQHELAVIRENYWTTVPERPEELDAEWPRQSDIDALVQMSMSNFLVATIICRFVADRSCGNPAAQLHKLLLPQDLPSQAPMFHAIYSTIVFQPVAGLSLQQGETIVRQFRLIVGAIVLLKTPLSALALAKLLDVPISAIHSTLSTLQSVLNIPVWDEFPVTVRHHSFRDFLVDPDMQHLTPFWIDQKQTHMKTALSCLRVMEAFLRKDMCGLELSGMEASIADRERVDIDIPAEVQYACLNWVFHLQQSDCVHFEAAFQFLERDLLYWVEALCLMRQASKSIDIIRNLESLLEDRQQEFDERHNDLLQDSITFLGDNLSTISLAPLQIYSSALVFTSHQSSIRNTFGSRIPKWIRLEPKLLQSGRDRPTNGFPGHSDVINSVAFSPDSSLVATGSADRTVRLWQADTGKCSSIFDGHNLAVLAVAFSPDSLLLASASADGTVQLWRPDAGKNVWKFEGHSREVRAVAFSHDSLLLASASADGTVRLWRVDTGMSVDCLEGHIYAVTAVAFSKDSSLVASGSVDETARLWRTDTGASVACLGGHGGTVTAVAFSNDSLIVASASVDDVVRLWDTAGSGQCLAQIKAGLTSKISFGPGDLQLFTDVGAFAITTTEGSWHATGYGFNPDFSWITWNGNNLLCLPPRYRPIRTAVRGSTVAFGCQFGELLVMAFSDYPA